MRSEVLMSDRLFLILHISIFLFSIFIMSYSFSNYLFSLYIFGIYRNEFGIFVRGISVGSVFQVSYSDTKTCVPFSVYDVLFSKSQDSSISFRVIWIRDKVDCLIVFSICVFNFVIILFVFKSASH